MVIPGAWNVRVGLPGLRGQEVSTSDVILEAKDDGLEAKFDDLCLGLESS